MSEDINVNAIADALNGKVDVDDFYFKSGDRFYVGEDTKCVAFTCAGFLTGSKTTLSFSIVLPKSMKNISSVNVVALSIDARLSSGGYLPSSGWDVVANSDRVECFFEGNYLRIDAVSATKFSSFTNNIPLTVNLRNSIDIRFS